MQISNKFPKLREENAVIIVTGKQDAVFYRVKDGFIEKMDAFKVPRPRYSDNEGHFRTRNKGEVIASGWTRELRDNDIIKDFLREFKDRLKQIPLDFEKLYLFVPSHIKNEVKSALPKTYQEKFAREVLGNFYYRSPQYLIEKLEQGV